MDLVQGSNEGVDSHAARIQLGLIGPAHEAEGLRVGGATPSLSLLSCPGPFDVRTTYGLRIRLLRRGGCGGPAGSATRWPPSRSWVARRRTPGPRRRRATPTRRPARLARRLRRRW